MAGNVLVSAHMITSEQISSHRTYLSKGYGENDSLTVPLHPLRIKPAGNAYTATENIKLAAGLFKGLPDELIIQVLEYLDAASLKELGCTCKALYAFTRLEELWKALCIEYGIPLFVLSLPPHCHNVDRETCIRNLQCICRPSFLCSARGQFAGLIVCRSCKYHSQFQCCFRISARG